MASSYTESSSIILEKKIKEHHKQYKLLFGNLKPKHHFLVHYIRAMRKLGPLRHVTTIRPEVVHKIFKTIASSITSRVNPGISLALKNQLSFAYRLLKNEPMDHSRDYKIKDKITLDSLENYQHFENFDLLKHDVEIDLLSSINYDGTLYKSGRAVCINAIDMELPIFGKIDFIIKSDDNVWFIINQFKTEELSLHYQSYIVKKENIWKFIKKSDLHCHMLFQYYERESDGTMMICKTYI